MADALNSVTLTDAEVRRSLPKHARLKAAVRQRLERLPAGGALPTIAALRAEYDVSLATVDRALRELRQEGLIEVRHGSGIYATGRQRLQQVAVYVSFDLLAPQIGLFPRLLLKGLHDVAQTRPGTQLRHYLSVGANSPWHERADTLAQDVRRHLVDGIIMVALYGGEFADLPVPVVALGALPGATYRVDLDYAALVRAAVTELQRRGCRRLGFIGANPAKLPPRGHFSYDAASCSRRTLAAFRDAVAAAGLKTRELWQCGSGVAGLPAVVQDGHDALVSLWQARTEKPDGIVSIDDYATTGALGAMRELGIVPGRDVVVASHANQGSDLLANQPVVRIEFDPAQVAGALLQSITELIAGRPRVTKTRLVPPGAAKG